MKKKEILNKFILTKLDGSTVFIQNKNFNFSYTKSPTPEYNYFGGLQCEYHEESVEYKLLEKWLCGIAEQTLNIHPNYKTIEEFYNSAIKDSENLTKKEILKLMDDYAEQSTEVIYNLYNTPAQVLRDSLEDLFRKEHPKKNDGYYIPDRTSFYKWIVTKVLENKTNTK